MLTVKQIEAAKPKEKPYRLLDGNGLYLYVPVSGKKVWQLRYKIDGKEKILTVGKYPLMTLQEARDKAWTARKEISVVSSYVLAEGFVQKTHLKVGFIIRFLVSFFRKPFLFLFRILLLSHSSLRHQEAYRYADAKP